MIYSYWSFGHYYFFPVPKDFVVRYVLKTTDVIYVGF